MFQVSLGRMARRPHAASIALATLILCTFTASSRLAGAQSDEVVYTVGNGVTPPRVTHQVDPLHPARGFRISGTVLIGLIITSKGEPTEVHVVRSLEKEVDQAAVDAVKQWHFEPASREGKPVAVKINIEIRFHDM